MGRTLLTALALISLAACGGAKEQAQAKPLAVKRAATTPKLKARTTASKANKATPVRKAARAQPAPEDTATPRNPLLNH